MKHKNRILSLLMAAVMLLSLLPTAAFAAEEPAGEQDVISAEEQVKTPESAAKTPEEVVKAPEEESSASAAEQSAVSNEIAVQAANATGTVYANTTVKISELAVGSIIKENVMLEDDTGESYVKINISDGTLKVNQDSSGTWTYVSFFKEKGVLEAFAGWGYSYDQLEVTENLYVKQPSAAQYATGTLELNGFMIGKAKSDAAITVTDGTGIASAEVIGFSSEGQSAYDYNKDDVFGLAYYNVKVQVNLADGFEIEEADGKAVGITLEGAEQKSFSDGNCLIFKMNGKAASGESTFIDFGEKVTKDEAQNYVKGKTTNEKGYVFDGWWAYVDGRNLGVTGDLSAAKGLTYTARWKQGNRVVVTTPLDLENIASANYKELYGDRTGCSGNRFYSNSDQGWEWDAATNTLTLDGCVIDVTADGGAAILLPDANASGTAKPATIILKDGTGNIIVNNGAAGEGSYGIEAQGALTISGSGTLTVSAADIGLYAADDLAIKAPVTAAASDGAVCSRGKVTVDDSLRIREPEGGRVENQDGWGTIIDSKDITASKVTITARVPFFTDGFGTEIAKADAESYVKGETKNDKGYTFAGWFDEKGDELKDVTKAAADVTYTAKWTMNDKAVRSTMLDLTNQKTDIASTDEGWSWNAKSKTLTLSGATIDVNDAAASIALPDGATVTTAKNTKNTVVNRSAAQDSYGILSVGALTVDGEGELSVTGVAGGLYAADDLAINAPVTAKATGTNGKAVFSLEKVALGKAVCVKTPNGGSVVNNESMGFVADENGAAAKDVVIAEAEPVFADGFGKTDCAFTAYQKGDKNDKGYTFAGWFDDKGNELTDAAKAAAGVTYTAKWTKDGKTVRSTMLDLTNQKTDIASTDEGWSWNAKSKTLTLSGATIDVNDAAASIALPDGATVTTAKNTKNTVVNRSAAQDSYGILSVGALTVDGEGELSVTGVAGGLYAADDLAINAPVTAKATGTNGKAVFSLEKVTLGKAVRVKTPNGGSVVNNESMGFVADENGAAAKDVVIAEAESKPPVTEKATFTDGLGNTIDNAGSYVKNKTKNAKGYTFAGWFDEKGNELTDVTKAIAGVTYTARWTKDGKLVRTEVLDLSGQTVDLKDIAEGWSWDAKSKTLTLNGATIDVNKRSSEPDMEGEGAILLPDGAVIVTASGSKNVVVNGSTIEGAFGLYGGAGIVGMGSLTIKGSGQFSVTGGNYGIAAVMGSLTINAPVSVKTTGTRGNVYAILAEKLTVASSLRVKTPAGGKLSTNEHGMFVADRSGAAAKDVVIAAASSHSTSGTRTPANNTTDSGSVKSVKTGDAGIALYAGLAVMAMLGAGVMLGLRKRKEF